MRKRESRRKRDAMHRISTTIFSCLFFVCNLLAQSAGSCISNCQTTIDLNGSEQNFSNYTFQATEQISSSATISSISTVSYHAGDNIVLNAGFEVQAGAIFHAYIAEGCSLGNGADNVLEDLLQGLRTDLIGTLQVQSETSGWPAPVCGGFLFASTNNQLNLLSGDQNNWGTTTMTADQGFHWIVVDVPPGNRYKFTDLNTWQADPWSRSYTYDEYGAISMVNPTVAHLERFFNVTDGIVIPRTVRVWVPEATATHAMYMHDGQNLFDPDAIWGGWMLDQSVPPAMMVVGIDNTANRMAEYTHVEDYISGNTWGGEGDAYADFVQFTVRQLVRDHYGEAPLTGVMGSSLGGLISFHIALRHAGEFDFAGSMSGTMGWGSIGLGVQNQTIIEKYQAAGLQSISLYLDSGGRGSCYDDDGDGIEDDDPNAADNYCENKQLEQVLYGMGYVAGVNVWHWWEPDASHNEAAWGERVFRPLGIFAGL